MVNAIKKSLRLRELKARLLVIENDPKYAWEQECIQSAIKRIERIESSLSVHNKKYEA